MAIIKNPTTNIIYSSNAGIKFIDGITNDGDYPFYSNNIFKSIMLPSTVTSMTGEYSSGLKKLTILATTPPSLDRYAKLGGTFPIFVPQQSVNIYKTDANWSSRASRIYPSTSLLVMEKNAEFADGLTNIGSGKFSGMDIIEEIAFPDTVVSIALDCFPSSNSIKRIFIPHKVTELKWNCDLPSVEYITIAATTPPSLNDSTAFDYTNNCPIYVPADSVNTYKTTTNWSSYASRIEAIPNV